MKTESMENVCIQIVSAQADKVGDAVFVRIFVGDGFVTVAFVFSIVNVLKLQIDQEYNVTPIQCVLN